MLQSHSRNVLSISIFLTNRSKNIAYDRLLCPSQFNTAVEKVKPVSMETEMGGAVTWEVISHRTCGDRNTQTFDSVFVCNG